MAAIRATLVRETRRDRRIGRRHARAVGDGRRERFRRQGVREHRVGLRLTFGPDAAPGPRRRDPADGHQAGRPRPRSRRRHRHQRRALSADCAVTGIDLSSSMLEKARERIARKGVRNVRLLEMDAADHEVRRRHLRHRLRAVRDQRRARPGRGRARNAPRLPSRRPHHHPQPLPQQEPRSARGSSGSSRRSPSIIGFKSDLDLPAFLAQATQAGVDREGEHPADLVARHLHQELSRSAGFSWAGAVRTRSTGRRRRAWSVPRSR